MSLFNSYFRIIKKISNWQAWLISLFILLLAYYVVNSSFIGSEHVKEISGGTAILDSYFYFPPHSAYDVLTALGEAGRNAYLVVNVLDMLFPFAYGLFLTISMTMTYTYIYPMESKRNLFILLPLLAVLADLGENICIFILLSYYPTPLIGVATIASLLTPLKYTLIVVVALLILQGNMKVTNKLFGKK